MKYALVYITCPNKTTAQKISRDLLAKQLIACANVFPIESVYRWQGKIAQEKEVVVLGKTWDKNYGQIKNAVAKIHPYSIPCILKIPFTASEKFGKWMDKEIKK